ncbi:MAG: hypothetical protein CMN32_08140 [Saprospirales bacterium]|nr:hypothetical protein [Saprospirales bacterium]
MPLWRDDSDFAELNRSYIAHIYGYAENSARYDKILSPKLEKDFSNLMLMCDTHHRRIDSEKTRGQYPAERLIKMKKDHESRIEFLTGLTPDKRSHVVLFGSKIGVHESPLHINRVHEALLPNYYPASPNPIELGLSNSSFEDSRDNYWNIQTENLMTQFMQKIGTIKGTHEVQHFSIFALAPQPLLIKLGTLFSDIYSAEVYQLHREPSTWSWLDEDNEVRFEIIEPEATKKIVALKLELSATIIDDRIIDVLGSDCDIWSIRHDNPNNDFLRSKADLQNFRKVMRIAFDRIKAKHGQDAKLHIFPAMPVSAAIELGRVWMPKADLPMIIYDQNWKREGFFKTITITN